MFNLSDKSVLSLPRLLACLFFTGWMGHVTAAPISDADTVAVDGREWAQMDLFSFSSWDAVNEICPAGVCSGSVTAGNVDVDLAGWTWASSLDVAGLFNAYIGTDALAAAATHTQENSESVNDMLADGWRLGAYDYVEGWTADAPTGLDGAPVASLSQIFLGDPSSGRPVPTQQTFMLQNDNRRDAFSGLWLYRDSTVFGAGSTDPDPDASVPTAGSLALFSLGFSLLLVRRLRK